MLYFAYGSNLEWQQMRNRCPSAKFVCIACFKDHRLDFTRRSINRNCGVADVVSARGSEVWGAVFEIAERDIGQLDKCEGYRPGRDKNSYVRHERHVCQEGDGEKPLSVAIYIGVPEENPPLPNEDYKRILVEGAKFWHLPKPYIEQLEQIKTTR